MFVRCLHLKQPNYYITSRLCNKRVNLDKKIGEIFSLSIFLFSGDAALKPFLNPPKNLLTQVTHN